MIFSVQYSLILSLIRQLLRREFENENGLEMRDGDCHTTRQGFKSGANPPIMAPNLLRKNSLRQHYSTTVYFNCEGQVVAKAVYTNLL